MCETNGTSVDICATPTMKIVKKKFLGKRMNARVNR